ncbi:MAG: DUF2177 family protein [Bacilli bacterium]|nr:DUF2177 family protein [Bacilli bacterium]
MNHIKMYIIALIIFLILDGIWLLLISKNLYSKEIGHLMADNANIFVALIFYLVFLVGLVYFVISPGIESGNVLKLITGAILFGFVTYATYDLTNLATLKAWPIKITIIDLIWGTFLSTAVSYLTYIIYKII